MAEFDRDQLATLDKDRKSSEIDFEMLRLVEKARLARQAKEKRTGTRPLPEGRGKVIINRVVFGRPDLSIENNSEAVNLWDNRRGNPGSFGGGL